MARKPKILVADDSLTVRKLVEMLLLQEGYEIALADTGAKCLALSASSPPDLILLDYVLPDMKGVDVCRGLMNSPSTWEIPVLLMSSNGNAIRQLYQDMNNVADYLTKPFPPNVLKAVVAHVMERRRREVKPAPAPADEISEVSQLLGGQPPAQLGLEAAPTTDATAPQKPSRLTSAMITGRRVAPEAVVQKFRQVLRKHWRTAWQQIPAWERERGPETAESFYEARFLAEPLWKELGSDLLSATGLPVAGSGSFRCPASLVALDVVLRHLHAARATGELRTELGEENVSLFLQEGLVVFVTSNHPRRYCAGAAFGFHTTPHATIAAAVRAQETRGTPFFVTLHEAGALGEGISLEQLLREQGERAVVRAYQAETATHDFRPLEVLPELVQKHRLHFPLWQLLLLCYRTVEDWFTIEQALPDFSAGLTPSADSASRLRQLRLLEAEERVLAAISPSHTVQQIVDASGLGAYEAGRVLFRFVKLGVFFSAPCQEEPDQLGYGTATEPARPYASGPTDTPAETTGPTPASENMPEAAACTADPTPIPVSPPADGDTQGERPAEAACAGMVTDASGQGDCQPGGTSDATGSEAVEGSPSPTERPAETVEPNPPSENVPEATAGTADGAPIPNSPPTEGTEGERPAEAACEGIAADAPRQTESQLEATSYATAANPTEGSEGTQKEPVPGTPADAPPAGETGPAGLVSLEKAYDTAVKTKQHETERVQVEDSENLDESAAA